MKENIINLASSVVIALTFLASLLARNFSGSDYPPNGHPLPVGSMVLLHLENAMNKNMMKEFLRWLEYASNENLATKKEEIISLLGRVTNRDIKADLRFCIRLIDEEVIARSELYRLESRRQ